MERLPLPVERRRKKVELLEVPPRRVVLPLLKREVLQRRAEVVGVLPNDKVLQTLSLN